MKKQEILAMLERFSDEVNPEEFIDELYLKSKLERSEQAIASGNTIQHDDVIKRSREWFK